MGSRKTFEYNPNTGDDHGKAGLADSLLADVKPGESLWVVKRTGKPDLNLPWYAGEIVDVVEVKVVDPEAQKAEEYNQFIRNVQDGHEPNLDEYFHWYAYTDTVGYHLSTATLINLLNHARTIIQDLENDLALYQKEDEAYPW